MHNNEPITLSDYGEFETAWCPGCGNFGILKAVKQALAVSHLAPQQIIFVSGIGQAAKAPHYLRANFFNGLHGRSLPVATGIRLANPTLKVIVESGDGCMYGEGGNHFLAAIRRNINVTVWVHNNQVYGLTKGQASPTSEEGFTSKAQPHGIQSRAFNPVEVAVAMRASFVARGFSGWHDHLVEVLRRSLAHPGFALVDILQPCVSFNTANTFKWYSDRCVPLPAEHDPGDWRVAMDKAGIWGDQIPVGVLYEETRPVYETRLNCKAPAGRQPSSRDDHTILKEIMLRYA